MPSTELPVPTAPTSEAGLIGREAIVDRDRAVMGYELFDRTPGPQAASGIALLLNLLSAPDAEGLLGRHTIFIRCEHESLSNGDVELVPPERVVLMIPSLQDESPAAVTAMRALLAAQKERGFRLAFDQGVLRKAFLDWLPLASYVRLDLAHFAPQIGQSLVRLVLSNTKAQVIAQNVHTAEQQAQFAGYGISLFQGHWFARPTALEAKGVRPSQAIVLQLINLVRKQADPIEIEELLKRDPTLSFNLLRFINSAGFGLSTEVTSFRHAVMILGLNKLFRWAAMLMTTPQDGSAPALGTTAVVRGRLMELLAAEIMPPEECDNAFVVGVFSLLDAMLGMPIAKALESLSLPQSVTDALLHRRGPLAPLLTLTEACESEDDKVFAETAIALKLSNHQVNWAHLNALAWADDMAA
ncbi:EAL and HDOD domain-containing protein [Xylophilus sp. GOD-11R]|uniref:EAL and HDOD domain-containing protein n=1 Tax=Xylophilus sp. GOD-11R TaxID=3089814 RepID=UPI00298CDE9B|nr:HDOD domain-containing protein [Xylophilus sp. GOD-11R]WPB58170.1 HDOD domain-containing protein [Xylophilus sp. GOD-11R]